MARGKQTCWILKEIRRQIAEANGIEFATSECRFRGNCPGTCPKCEAEVRYLEQQLRARSLAGKAVTVAGISAASIAMLMPMTLQAESPQHIQSMTSGSKPSACVETPKVRGYVFEHIPDFSGALVREYFVGAKVMNLTNGRITHTKPDGMFEIEACVGDSIQASYIGFPPETVTVKDLSEPINIVLSVEYALTGEVVITNLGKNYIELTVLDENNKSIPPDKIRVKRLLQNVIGKDNPKNPELELLVEPQRNLILWNRDPALLGENGKPVKEAILSIEAEGYNEPVIIKVKYPKRETKKTVKFRHKK